MVSIIIPTYNRAEHITKAVNSVLDQSYADLELIIVDDGSSDDTKERISMINDSRIKYIYQDNAGACVARNRGIEMAQGQYIAFLDSDDVWHLDKLEKQIKIIQEKGADLVFSKYNRNESKKTKKGPIYYKEGFLEPVSSVYAIGTQTIIAKREVFEEFRFDEDMPRFQDLELLLRISQKYSMYCMDEALVEYNITPSSISKNPQKLYKAFVLMCEKHPDFISQYPQMAKQFSNLVFIETPCRDKSKKDLNWKMYKLAYKFYPNWRTIAKIVLKYIKLHDLMEKICVRTEYKI